MRDPVMDDRHEHLLKTIAGLNEEQTLPQRVIDLYWEFKRAMDRIGCPVADRDLAWLSINSKVEVPCEPDRGFVADAVGLALDTVVEAKWRFGRWYKGWYKGMSTGGMVKVQLDDDTGEVRDIPADSVRLLKE